MSCSMPRVVRVLCAALLLTLGCAAAAELSRPVPPDAQVTRFTRFNIHYEVRDMSSSGVQKVEFYITEDMGRTWRLYGEDPDRRPPMVIQVPGEGVYGIVSVVTDSLGNRERPPVARTRPETVIVVDQTPPTAKWLEPQQDVLGRGTTIPLRWESADPYFGPSPVRIQYAVGARNNFDRDAVWTTLEENLSASGSMDWTPPAGTTARYNFRLIAEDRAGNMAVAYCPATIVVDGTPPMITSVMPLRSNTLENDILVEADDGPGGSGVKEISLYTSANGGGTWNLVKETLDNGESVPVRRRPGEGIAFTSPHSGEFALWPVVFDEAGNATPLPSVGVPGPYILTIDTEKPQVSLSNSFLMGRAAVLANETRRVEWTAYDPHLLANSAVIHISLDNGNTWQELRSGMPASGSEIISFPFGAQSEEAKLRVTVADEFGNVGEDISETFKLSNAATTVESVTPLGGSPSGTPVPSGSLGGQAGSGLPSSGLPGQTGGWEPFPDETGSPVFIPINPVHPLDGQSPSAPQTPGVAAPIPAPQPVPGSSQFPSSSETPSFIQQLPLGQGTGWSQPDAFPPLQTDPAPQYPTGTPSQYADPDMTAFAGESTASSIPSAMLPQGAPQEGLPASSAGLPASSLEAGWTPSPAAGTPSQPLSPPSQPAASWDSPGDLASAGSLTPADPFQPPPALPGPASGTGVSSGLPDFPGFDTSSSVSPPPLQPPSSDGSFPVPPADLAGSPLNLPAGSLPAPTLSAPETPAAPVSGIRPPSDPSALPLQSPTAGLDTIPPIEPPAASRPPEPLALSNHLVQQSKDLQAEGRIQEALERANEAASVYDRNPRAFMQLSQLNARSLPPDFVRAANQAKQAADLDMEWESWWNCAEVYYIWSHARNREIQGMLRAGRTPPMELVDERNSTLSNAKVAINNAAVKAVNAGGAARKKIAITHGLIVYLEAMTIPEPVRPAEQSGPAADQYRQDMTAYKAAVTPKLMDAQPYFTDAMRLDGPPTYSETFHLGMIHYRLGTIERDTGNISQAGVQYQEAARYLEEATTSGDVPNEGPREAYYMLAHCHDILSTLPGGNTSRQKELALRYWRLTVELYPQGTPYRSFAEQRLGVLAQELGQ